MISYLYISLSGCNSFFQFLNCQILYLRLMIRNQKQQTEQEQQLQSQKLGCKEKKSPKERFQNHLTSTTMTMHEEMDTASTVIYLVDACNLAWLMLVCQQGTSLTNQVIVIFLSHGSKNIKSIQVCQLILIRTSNGTYKKQYCIYNRKGKIVIQ